MKKFFLVIIFIILIPAFAYEVYFPGEFSYKNKGNNLLFVIDFSNSMGEYLNHKTKANHVKETLKALLPQISPETKFGVRVYGHTCNIFAYNACRSSELLTPIKTDNANAITSAISKLRPRGMTPITYSLKQAVKKDFENIEGDKHIILLTDGGENCDESPCDYSIELVKKRKDIKIDVIAFDVKNSDDLAQLQCTADVTGGRLIQTDTEAELKNYMNDLILPHKQVEALLYSTQ